VATQSAATIPPLSKYIDHTFNFYQTSPTHKWLASIASPPNTLNTPNDKVLYEFVQDGRTFTVTQLNGRQLASGPLYGQIDIYKFDRLNVKGLVEEFGFITVTIWSDHWVTSAPANFVAGYSAARVYDAKNGRLLNSFSGSGADAVAGQENVLFGLDVWNG